MHYAFLVRFRRLQTVPVLKGLIHHSFSQIVLRSIDFNIIIMNVSYVGPTHKICWTDNLLPHKIASWVDGWQHIRINDHQCNGHHPTQQRIWIFLCLLTMLCKTQQATIIIINQVLNLVRRPKCKHANRLKNCFKTPNNLYNVSGHYMRPIVMPFIICCWPSDWRGVQQAWVPGIPKQQSACTPILITHDTLRRWWINAVPWSSTLAGTIKQHWWNVSCLLDVPIVGAEGNHCKCTQIVTLCFT